MGIWIELHCDNQAPVTNAVGSLQCISGRGDQPGTMTMTRPAQTARRLMAEAKIAGWVRNGDKWTCPVCAAWWKAHNAKVSGGAFPPSA